MRRTPAIPRLTPLPAGMRFWHPSCLLATWFGSGRLPHAPGTFGAAAALPFAWVIQLHGGSVGLLLAASGAFAVGLWAAQVYVRRSGVDDPGSVVIDEVAGQWLALAAVPLDPLFYFAAFLLFRVSDIVKPWPVRWIDRRVAGSWGVMADDVFAALYAAAALLLLDRWVL